MKEHFTFVGGLGAMAIIAALFAWGCSVIYAHKPEDAMFFGTKIPMAVFGIVGYALIALTARGAIVMNWWKPIMITNHIMVIFAGVFTIYLVFKAVSVNLVCPGCWLCWIINIILAGQTIMFLVKS